MKRNETAFKSLSEIESIIRGLGKGVRKSDLPTMGHSTDFAHPSIEVDADGYHYVVVERGTEIRHDITSNLDQLLFWVFEDITFTVAVRETSTENCDSRDQRRAYFLKQEELLDNLNMNWGQAIRQKHAKLLARFPFDDFARARSHCCKEFRESGLSDDAAWQAACEKFPVAEQGGGVTTIDK